MLEFAPNTYMLEYQDGAYLCNGTKRVEAPLNLETLEEAVRQCTKLQVVSLDDEGLVQDAQIKKLEHICIAACHRVTSEGLLAISWRDKLRVSDGDMHDKEGLAAYAPTLGKLTKLLSGDFTFFNESIFR